MCMERGDTLSSLSDDEVGELKSAIRARDVRAAGLQEEPTKRGENRADFQTSSFRRIRRRRRLPANIAASGASQQAQRAKASEAIKLSERSN